MNLQLQLSLVTIISLFGAITVPTTTYGQFLVPPPTPRSMSPDTMDMVHRTLLYHDDLLLGQQQHLQRLENRLVAMQKEVDRWESVSAKRIADQGLQIGSLGVEQEKMAQAAKNAKSQFEELKQLVEEFRESLDLENRSFDQRPGLPTNDSSTQSPITTISFSPAVATTRNELATFKVTTQTAPARLVEVDGRFVIALAGRELNVPVLSVVCRKSITVMTVIAGGQKLRLVWHPCDQTYVLVQQH